MKKIKYILGFGILGALFSSCFSQDYSYRNVEYFSTTNNINNYQFANNVAYNSLYSYINSGGSIVSYSPYYVSSLGSLDNSVFDLSNYSLGEGSYSRNPSGKVYLSNNGALSLLIGPNYTLFPIVPGNLTTNDLLVDSEPVYIRVNNDSSSCYNYDSINGNCTNALRSFTHTSTTVYDSLRGQVHDSVIDGVDWQKGTISSSIYNNYSYTFALSGLNYDGYNVSFTSGFLNFKTVVPTISGNYYSLDGVYLFRLNDLYLVNSSTSFQVIAIAFTGNSLSNYDFVYSVYNCPSNSKNIYDCSFDNGGYLKPSSNGNSFNSYDGKLFSTTASYDGNWYNETILFWRNFLYFLFYRAGSLTFYNSYNSNTNIIEFYRYGYFSNDANSVNYSLSLDPLAGIDIIAGTENPFPDSGGGNQSSLNRPSYTSGQVASCRNPSYYGISALGEGFSNPICDEINSLIYVGEDENGNSIYVYYNDDGSWWVRTMGEANLTSVSAPSGFEIDSSGNVTTIWEVVCTGNFCDDYLSGLKAEDLEQYRYVNIEFGDAIILNTGYYENFFSSLNVTGYVFKCPYTYSNSRFVLGKNIIKKLGGYDPFLPINCFVASFENGRKVQFFDDAFGGFNRGPLVNGDTQNHKNLFGFFDILLSIGLIFFLMKFYHLFK